LFGAEGRVLEKKEWASGKNRRHWEGRTLGDNFLFIIQNPFLKLFVIK